MRIIAKMLRGLAFFKMGERSIMILNLEWSVGTKSEALNGKENNRFV